MQKIRYGLIVAGMLLCLANSAAAQVSIGIGLPNLSIGINLPLFPQLVRVPGYPVYYAPQVNGNYFFYDGMYWVYQNDNWYASSWYNGPWGLVQPYYVPLFILRIPVSYYRQPPAYFRGWQPNAPPRWGQHWGRDWEQRRSGWDRWNRSSAPAPAPLPVYQRQYSGDKYPRVEKQQVLRTRQYNYQPRETAVRQHFQQLERRTPVPGQGGRQEAPRVKKQGTPPVEKQETPRAIPRQQGAPPGPNSQPPRRGGEHVQKITPDKPASQQRAPAVQKQRQQPAAAQQQQAPMVKEQVKKQQDRGPSQGPNRGQGQGQNKDDERGRGRDK
ncbi:MAG: hypothetical protein PHR66_02565 [Desulfuromonadaceae bacterium]|nr:hypothetical protein [Desulfuromonadaceae bacterium]